MRIRLQGWRASALSKVGRITLIKSVLNAIHVFLMQTVIVLVSVCKEMEKICRDFLWHGRSEARKIYLVNWDTVTKSKKLGGLGIRCMRSMNQAMVGK